MLWLLRLSFGLIGFLIFFGGTVLKTSFGKIEIGSVDPWAWLALLFFWLAWVVDRKGAERFYRELYDLLKAWFSEGSPRIKLAVALLIFATLIFTAHLFRYWNFDTNLFDMGMVNQALFHPFESGHLFHSSTSPRQSYLVDHFAPVLFLIAPLTALIKSNALVFGIQALLLVWGVWTLVVRGPLKNSPELMIYAALILVANRAYRSGGLWDFREDVFGFLFLSFALVALVRGHIGKYALALIGFVLSKEHLGVLGCGVIFPILFDGSLPYQRKQRLWIGGLTLLALVGWSGLLLGVIVPRLQAGMQDVNNISRHFTEFGNSPGSVIIGILTTPRAWWVIVKGSLLTKLALKYLFLVIAPYLFFLRKSWPWLVAASIGIAANIASDSEIQKSLAFHYDIAFMPFLMMGVLQGIRAEKIAFTLEPNRKLLLGLLLALCFSGRWPSFHIIQNIPSLPQIGDVRFIERIPCAGIVAANSNLLSKVNHCSEMRPLDLPQECLEGEALRIVGAGAEEARGGALNLRGRRGRWEANEFVLDSTRPCEVAFENVLLQNGGSTSGLSPSGKFHYLAIPESVGAIYERVGTHLSGNP